MDDIPNIDLEGSEQSSVKDTNPKDALGTAKVPFHCVSAKVMLELGLAMMEGGRKYGTHNYRKMGVRGSVYYNAAMRHMMDFWEGQDIDPDSGVHHIVKAIACMAILRDSQLMGNWEDDRPIRLPDGLNIAEMNEQAAEIIKKYPVCKMPFIEAGPKSMNSEERAKHRAARCPNSFKTRDKCNCSTCRGIRKLEASKTRRAGESWTGYEDDNLRQEVGSNLSIIAIAIMHKRTDGAITSRMELLNITYKLEIKHEKGKVTYDDAVDGECYADDRLCLCGTCRAGWNKNII